MACVLTAMADLTIEANGYFSQGIHDYSLECIKSRIVQVFGTLPKFVGFHGL